MSWVQGTAINWVSGAAEGKESFTGSNFSWVPHWRGGGRGGGGVNTEIFTL